MAYELYTGSYDDEQARVAYYMRLFQFVRTRRVNFEPQWEEIASVAWPEYRNSFTFGHARTPGQKYTEFQVDSSGSVASHRFMAIADTLMTPDYMVWSVLRASDKDLMRDRSVKLWFEDASRVLWEQRYRPEANFADQQKGNWQKLGVFGNQSMFIDELETQPWGDPPGLRYIGMSPGEIYLLTNSQGRVDGFIRHFRWSARQAYQQWPDKIPLALKAALEQGSQELFDFLQFVLPNTDYQPFEVFTPRSKRWSSCYVSVVGYTILEEGGYRSFPLPTGRYMVAPEEEYGRGPGQMVLPELKTLNAAKVDYLSQSHQAGRPAYLLPGDDALDFKTHPGAFNYGGISEDGKKLVDVMPTGNIQITKEMLDDSRKVVDDAFLVSLYPLLFDKEGKPRSARETVELANDRSTFLAPTLGPQFGYLGAMIHRELDILSYLRLLPPMPPALKEAKGNYKIVYTSPAGRAFQGHGIAGFMRTVQMAGEVAQITGDQSIFDIFEFDEAFPEISEQQFSPTRWMSSPQQVAQKRKQRAQAQERENQVKELPGRAAIIKAQAIGQKAAAGMNIGGALSGTPQGGMPMVPQQVPSGMPGQPGIGGRPGLSGRPAR